VSVQLADGQSEPLAINAGFEQVFIDQRINKQVVRIILIFLLIVLCAVFYRADYLTRLIFAKSRYSIKPSVVFGLTLLLSFSVLLSLGITGSSFSLGFKETPFVDADMINVWGKDQPIRSDEWLVLTPLAIAQYQHQPQFPVVNSNLGEDGHNMLVVGMAGLPVAHITALAKPATWGYFLFDLKRALAWQWCFPLFACLFALWGVVALLLPGRWQASFLIALWFSVSPYVAAWSNWPAYTVFFPSLALLLSIAILRSHSLYALLLLGCVLGLALAGFVLVLYPPWQVSLGYVFLALTVAIVVRDKLYQNFNTSRLTAFGVAILVTGLILWEWWSDAQTAIAAMMATVYPGQRTALTGGDLSLPFLLRGFTNMVTLKKLASPVINQSEIASFYYLLLPLIMLFGIRLYQKKIGIVEVALAASISFILFFGFIGIPAEVAQFSQWGRVLPRRADLALGLSYILLCGVLLSSNIKSKLLKMPIKILAFVVALTWAAIALNSVFGLHETILARLSPGKLAVLFLVVALAGYWLAVGKLREFIFLNLAVSVVTIWPFNPINIAPNSIKAISTIASFNKNNTDNGLNQRILVLESHVPAMYLLVSGLPVANGVFYYPQPSLWQRLDKDRQESNTYNRYQHLFFTSGIVENSRHYKIESPHVDVVRVVLESQNFDFRLTGAGLLASPLQYQDTLARNTSLNYLKSTQGWSWFRIRGATNDN